MRLLDMIGRSETRRYKRFILIGLLRRLRDMIDVDFFLLQDLVSEDYSVVRF